MGDWPKNPITNSSTREMTWLSDITANSNKDSQGKQLNLNLMARLTSWI